MFGQFGRAGGREGGQSDRSAGVNTPLDSTGTREMQYTSEDCRHALRFTVFSAVLVLKLRYMSYNIMSCVNL